MQIGEVVVETLDDSVTMEGTALRCTIRLVEIPTPIMGAQIKVISEYTEFVLTGTLSTIDYLLAGNITGVSPGMGQFGTQVAITGQDLIGLAGLSVTLKSVRLGSIEAEITQSSQDQVVVRASTGTAGNVDIRLNSTQTLSNGVILDGPYNFLGNGWTQLTDGKIDSIIPPAAQEGSVILLCGSSILGGGSAITMVSILGLESSNFSATLVAPVIGMPASECITATVPAPPSSDPPPQQGGVNLTSNTQAIVEAQSGVQFQYASITTVTPSEGQEFTQVTISGFHLLSGYSEAEVTPEVFLSGVMATVTNYSPTEIIVQAAPSSMTDIPGDVNIQVTRFEVTSVITLFNSWTYRTSGEIYTVTPSFGQYGTYITVGGNNLLGYGTSLQLALVTITGGSPVAAQVISSSSSQVVLEVPLPSNMSYVGPASIELRSDNGAQITGVDVFEYRVRGEVTGVSPSSGQNGTRGKLIHALQVEYEGVGLIYQCP